MEQQDIVNVVVIWRGKHLNVDTNPKSKVKELGQKLQKLTNVKPDTMRLLIPQSTNKRSKLITPFSDAHSNLSLQEVGIVEGKPTRMLGVFDDEIEEVSQNNKTPDMRIASFDEEEKRLRQRSSIRPQASLKLPQGPYTFSDFRTLHIPGIELYPAPSEALRRMHMLACDPGIVAIMNKHRWRVGVMTEMAPEGFVGISSECILGYNKNHGEEISLRLRTDDLRGFRKYESIKKTLLHELAHMVYSEHDANFFALNKQLNEEAAMLDWTKARSYTLSGHTNSDHYDEEFYPEASSINSGQKVGGMSNSLASARALAVIAAYDRFRNPPTNGLGGSQEKVHSLNEVQVPDTAKEPDPDDHALKGCQDKSLAEPDPDDGLKDDDMHVDIIKDNRKPLIRSSVLDERDEPDPDDNPDSGKMLEPEHDDSCDMDALLPGDEPDPDDSISNDVTKSFKQPGSGDTRSNKIYLTSQNIAEPDPDDLLFTGKKEDETQLKYIHLENRGEPDPDDHGKEGVLESLKKNDSCSQHPQVAEDMKSEPDPDDQMDGPDDEELRRIEEPIAALCNRLQKAIEMLREEVRPSEASSVLQTLSKIIRNVIEHPDVVKFRRLRKANPQFQRNVANYKAAMEVLTLVGFCEDVITDEVGRAETYVVLKRNDPGLLWLAKSSLEVSIG